MIRKLFRIQIKHNLMSMINYFRTIPRTPSFMRSSADGVYNNGQVSLHLDKGDITKYQVTILTFIWKDHLHESGHNGYLN